MQTIQGNLESAVGAGYLSAAFFSTLAKKVADRSAHLPARNEASTRSAAELAAIFVGFQHCN